MWGGGGLKTFLEGSVDHVIDRNYIVNRRFFIDCSLATTLGATQATANTLKTAFEHGA